MNKELLTAKEVSERYGVKVETVYVWTSTRKIPFIKIRGHRTMYPLDELLKEEEGGLRHIRH